MRRSPAPMKKAPKRLFVATADDALLTRHSAGAYLDGMVPGSVTGPRPLAGRLLGRVAQAQSIAPHVASRRAAA